MIKARRIRPIRIGRDRQRQKVEPVSDDPEIDLLVAVIDQAIREAGSSDENTRFEAIDFLRSENVRVALAICAGVDEQAAAVGLDAVTQGEPASKPTINRPSE